ncbi:MAG: membrane protein insertion efficiency factor YidD [bacterium]|nr:membrane protein insertion efficiency factor YidD [bacterium]
MNNTIWLLFMAIIFLCHPGIASAEPRNIQSDWQPWDGQTGQTGQTESILMKQERQEKQKKQEKFPALSPLSIVKSLPLSAIIIYQKIISPQQGGVCNFVPSCSQFGLQSIKKYGIIEGILMTSDRLQRCHYCVSGEYHYRPGGRFYDPVKNHCLSEDLRCLEYGYVEKVEKNAVIVPHSL